MEVTLGKDVASVVHKLPLDTPSAQDSEEYALAGTITAAYRLASENPLERSPDIEQLAAFGDEAVGSSSTDAIMPGDIAGRDQVSRSIRYQR